MDVAAMLCDTDAVRYLISAEQLVCDDMCTT